MEWPHSLLVARRRRKLEHAVKQAMDRAGGDVSEAALILKTMAATDFDLSRAWAFEMLEQIKRDNPGLSREEIGRVAMNMLIESARRRERA